MDKSKTKFFIELSVFIIILISIVAVIATFWPRYEERFIEFGLLGKNKTAEEYFPNDNPILQVGDSINWFIYVHNHLGFSKNVSIRIKIVNSLLDVLNANKNEPSSQPTLIELPLFLSVDETNFVPFSWTILETSHNDTLVILKQLLINDQIVYLDLPASPESSFSLIFELWSYDQDSGEYHYEQEIDDGFSSISLNIGFQIS